MAATRRLPAIFAADVVGYSRLMGADEEGTHERFKAHLREVVDPTRATPVDRRPALYESQRRPGAAVFRGRDHRGSDDRSLEAREYVRDLAQYRVHLPDKPIDTKQLGRDLGVRYVLEGSVRRSGSQVRVSAQLIDAQTDAHLWADRFDRDTGDLFALQNEITSRLANALGAELIAAKAARPTEHPDALDYILRGRAVLFKPRTRDTFREAINFYERALALDPQSIEAQCRLVYVLAVRVLNGMADSAAVDLARAEGLVDQALAASPRYALAHLVKGHVLRAQGRWEAAIPEYEAALALNHNLVAGLTNLGWCKLYAGSIEEVTPLVLLLPDWNRASAAKRTSTRQSSGSKKRATPYLVYRPIAAASPPMPSEAKPNAPPPNSPKPGGWAAEIFFPASPA
jgi:tetratricopeptide (TPR) repeat protein